MAESFYALCLKFYVDLFTGESAYLLFLLQFLKPLPTSDLKNTNISCKKHLANDLNSCFGIRIIENNIIISCLKIKILYKISCNVKNNVLLYHYKLLYIAGRDSDG